MLAVIAETNVGYWLDTFIVGRRCLNPANHDKFMRLP